MTPSILIVRPEPGASQTAERASKLGLDPVVASIFAVHSLPWTAPDAAEIEAVLVTSANAARLGGTGLSAFLALPCFAVGDASAAAATSAGFRDVREGPHDGEAALAMMGAAGVRRALHPCGRDHVPLARDGIALDRRIVYSSEPIPALPPAAEDALRKGALALLHSPRAAAHFAALISHAGLDQGSIALAALSGAVAEAAGPGWRDISVAARPRDEALLELAAKLCKTGAHDRRGRGG